MQHKSLLSCLLVASLMAPDGIPCWAASSAPATGQTTAAATPEVAAEAWWLHAQFSANDTLYAGLPVSSIDPTWAKLSVLSYEILPAEAKDDLEWMHEGGFVFAKEGKLSHRNLNERAVVGVYEDHAGGTGRFLLVLRKDSSGNWKKLFLHQETGSEGFSVLVWKAGKLYWGSCMQCENFRRVVMGVDGATLE